MLEPLKDSLLAGLGLATLAQEKLHETVRELIERGELTREQGARLMESVIAKGEKERQDLSGRLSREFQRWLGRTPFVSREEHRDLERRVRALEVKLAGEAPEEVEPLGSS
jgi:polyhydroxyalkanoate synthesis regulator phasin